MKKNQKTRFAIYIAIAFLIMIVIGGISFQNVKAIEEVSTELTNSILLPLLYKKFPPPPTVFGVEINRGYSTETADAMETLRPSWVRYNGILWHKVMPVEPVEDDGILWEELTQFEEDIIGISQNGGRPIVIIRGTPTWAREEATRDYTCGPIDPDNLDEFAAFVYEIVKKYSQMPYNVKYWELGNEPDAPPSPDTFDSPYGCWGDREDKEFFNGDAYAEMLKAVYPKIKKADPESQVVVGGLLLPCDPENPLDKNCDQAYFLKGILESGGGKAFDVLAYHAYPYWFESTVGIDKDLYDKYWMNRGGMLLGKKSYLEETMASYGISKPIIMDEGGLLCGWWETDPKYYQCQEPTLLDESQANYVVRLFARSWANGLIGSTWYTLHGPGWREGGLLDSDQLPRLAFDSYEFMIDQLREAVFVSQLLPGSGEGYEFKNTANGHTIQIYWTNSNADSSTIQKPKNTFAVFDHFGNDITGTIEQTESEITFGFDPIYVDIAP